MDITPKPTGNAPWVRIWPTRNPPMTFDPRRIALLTDEQIAYLRTLSPDEKWRLVSEINHRVRTEVENVIRNEVPFFTDEQVRDTVCAMLITKAIPECVNVRVIEKRVVYGATD